MCRETTEPFHPSVNKPCTAKRYMNKNTLNMAIEAVSGYGDRISLFTKKLRMAQYADSTIYSYRLKISQAVLYLGKLPDDFTQEDIDRYLSALLDRNRYSMSFFKHTVFGLKEYYKVMGIKEPRETSDDFVFKSHGRGATPQPIRPGYVRTVFKNALVKACLDHSLTIHLAG